MARDEEARPDKSVQTKNGSDLSGMIIVDSAIFRSILSVLTEDDLYKILLNNPMRPSSNELNDVSNWCATYFEVLSRLDAKIKTQADFGEMVGLTQSDVSSLMSARKGFYFGEDRIEALFTNIKNSIDRIRKRAS